MASHGHQQTEQVQTQQPIVFVIDDDPSIRDGMTSLFRSVDIAVETFGSADEFLRKLRPDIAGCIVLDVRLPGMSGMEFHEELVRLGISTPVVFVTGHADVPMGIQAMKAGAVEFLCKPFREEELLRAVRLGIRKDTQQRERAAVLSVIRKSFECLTPREQEVLGYIVSGLMNKQIAAKLNLSEITVKVHRASIMRKMQVRSLADLVRQADALELGPPARD